ncbi:hypothetical protein DFH09DRAFT_1300267 [Mycena vulgaris]|nr:hypothetical protein DFH09DRAFT_1300267 [Mycena vulgaris]
MPPYRPLSLFFSPSDDATDVLDQVMNPSSPPPRLTKTPKKKAQGQMPLALTYPKRAVRAHAASSPKESLCLSVSSSSLSPPEMDSEYAQNLPELDYGAGSGRACSRFSNSTPCTSNTSPSLYARAVRLGVLRKINLRQPAVPASSPTTHVVFSPPYLRRTSLLPRFNAPVLRRDLKQSSALLRSAIRRMHPLSSTIPSLPSYSPPPRTFARELLFVAISPAAPPHHASLKMLYLSNPAGIEVTRIPPLVAHGESFKYSNRVKRHLCVGIADAEALIAPTQV